ncbi:MAG: PAS domain S-box protein [Lentilitoribacter sp.]
MTNEKIQKALEENDRRGEYAISIIQILLAIAIFCLHAFSAFRNDWHSFSQFTSVITLLLLMSSLMRAKFAIDIPLKNGFSYTLTVLDGILIFSLIISYSFAYDLPFETVFKTPSIVLLLVYTCVRAVRIDVWSILTAALTVILGWSSLLLFSVSSGAEITISYVEYVTSTKLLIGANIEFMIGYIAIVGVLCMVALYARQLLMSSAHVDDLAEVAAVAENSLERMRSIIRSTGDGVVIVNSEGIIEQTNPALEKMFGYSREELIDQSVAKLMSEQNANLLRGDIQYFIQNGESRLIGQPFESLGLDKDKNTIPIEVSINTFDNSDRISFAGFIRDISDRKKAQAREKKALAQFEEAVQSALDAIIVIDSKDRIISFNPAAEEIFGYTAEETIGKKMANLIVPEKYRSAHLAGMQHYLDTGEGPVLGNRIEIEGMRKSGEEFELELAVRNIDSPFGSIFIGYARDITSRKAAEKELVTAKENAEVASKSKASFLAMMSHEIRTPLSGVLGILDLLKYTELTPEQKTQLEVANQSGISLMTIINDILDYSKLDAGRLEIDHGSFHVENAISSVTSLVKASAYNKNVELISSVNNDVPEYLTGDRHRISQVMINLVSNAIKFTNAGTVEILVENIGTEKKPNIRFCVKDSGLGIPEDKQDQLFTEFATLDQEYSTKFGGTGLGLAISKALVQAMDGSIAFESTYGLGSQFWFDLPLNEGQDIEKDTLAETAVIAVIDNSEPLKVLVADDNETNQMIISVILKRLGCYTNIVSDGLEAVQAVKDNSYDIILMDVSMPNMDGLEATRQIRNLSPEKSSVKIVALTAYTQEEDKLKVFDAGMDAFLSKPVFRNDIVTLINSILGQQSNSNPQSVPNITLQERDILNQETLSQVTDGMDDSDISELFGMFSRDLTRHLNNANSAVNSEDFALLERSSHGLKGLSGTFGATKLFELASTTNEQCINGQVNLTQAYEMIEESEKILAWVRATHVKQTVEFHDEN